MRYISLPFAFDHVCIEVSNEDDLWEIKGKQEDRLIYPGEGKALLEEET